MWICGEIDGEYMDVSHMVRFLFMFIKLEDFTNQMCDQYLTGIE